MTPSIETQAAAWLAHVARYPQQRGDFIDWLDEECKAGRMDWPDVRRWQNAAMPPCRACGGVTSGAGDLCVDCRSRAAGRAPRTDAEMSAPFGAQRGSR